MYIWKKKESLKKWAWPQSSPDITPLDFFHVGVCEKCLWCKNSWLWSPMTENHNSCSNSYTIHTSLYLNRNRVPLGCLYSYKRCWHQTSYGMTLNFESSYTFSEKDTEFSAVFKKMKSWASFPMTLYCHCACHGHFHRETSLPAHVMHVYTIPVNFQ